MQEAEARGPRAPGRPEIKSKFKARLHGKTLTQEKEEKVGEETYFAPGNLETLASPRLERKL